MVSLCKTAQCIGLSGPISITKDFFGYPTKTPKYLSLRAQVCLLQGKHIHLNIIRTASFDSAQQKKIDHGLQVMRNIYATVNMGVGRVQRFVTPPGHEVIDGHDEAEDLWNEFSVPNASIDVFLVRLVPGGVNGMSRTPGSCDKDSKNDSGCLIDVEDSLNSYDFTLGQNIAHEVGHYLGLKHLDDHPDNLMFPKTPNGGILYPGQGGLMALHCMVTGGCRA